MRFALVGNPNSGKTTLFNVLTGSTARTGNWPGVTVAKKQGVYKKLQQDIDIIDLPGIYSLSPYTPEEIVARNYIIDEKPDLLINIIDASNIERNLYLTTQLLEINVPIVIALNMVDVLEQEGSSIDIAVLSGKLGVPVVPISALNDKGIDELMQSAFDSARGRRAKSVLAESYFSEQILQIATRMKESGIEHSIFHAIKFLEGDQLELEHFCLLEQANLQSVKDSIILDELLEGDFEALIADARYKYIESILPEFFVTSKKVGELSYSERLDKVLTNRFFGIPLFLLFMFAVFHITFAESFLSISGLPSLGVFLQELVVNLTARFSELVSGLLTDYDAPLWLHGLVVDGIIAGVSAVMGFLPQILLLFLFLSILEDTGYMARAAFLMDRILRGFGLSGRSFMPLLMGFGCSVPAILGTRILESERERRLVIFLMPFFSCGAKLPIWVIFAGSLFPNSSDIAVFAIYISGIIMACCGAVFLNKTLLAGDVSAFVMELPAYRLPKLKSLTLYLWEKLRGFIYRAMTVIAGATIIIWLLSNFDLSLNMVQTNSKESILGLLGVYFVPVFKPLGFAFGEDAWKNVVAIFTGIVAKEVVVSTLGVLYSGEAVSGADGFAEDDLMNTLGTVFTPLSAVSFMLFNLLTAPCIAAMAAAKGELGTRWFALAVSFWLFVAWIISFAVYNIGFLMRFV